MMYEVPVYIHKNNETSCIVAVDRIIFTHRHAPLPPEHDFADYGETDDFVIEPEE